MEDFVFTRSSSSPVADQIPHHSLPSYYGQPPPPPHLQPAAMQCDPPPVTRLVADTLTAVPLNFGTTTPSFPRFDTNSLLCSESDLESTASSAESGKLGSIISQPKPLSRLLGASNIPPFRQQPARQSRSEAGMATMTNGDYRSPSSMPTKHPYHIPLAIKIPTKVRLPPQKDGKRINQHTYKPHAPGDGLLKIDIKPEPSMIPDTITMSNYHYPMSYERSYQGMTSVPSDHGILNIISTIDPGSKVPTPPASVLTDNSHSTGTSCSSMTHILTSSSDDQSQAAMAMTSLSLTQTTTTTGAKSKKSRSKAGGGVAKKRTSFSRAQVHSMEMRFDQQRYLTSVERKEFAASIGLDDNHVKVWFQNRRSKLKKQTEVSSSSGGGKPTGKLLQPRPPNVCSNFPPKQPFMHNAQTTLPSLSSAQHHLAPGPHGPAFNLPPPASNPYLYMNGTMPNSVSASQILSTNMSAPTNSSLSSMSTPFSMAMANSSCSAYAPGPGTLAPSVPCVSAAAAASTGYAHPFPPLITDYNQMPPPCSSNNFAPLPSMTLQTSSYGSMHPAIPNGQYGNHPYGAGHDIGVDHGLAFDVHGSSRPTSPFSFQFSPSFACHPEDSGGAPYMQIKILANSEYVA